MRFADLVLGLRYLDWFRRVLTYCSDYFGRKNRKSYIIGNITKSMMFLGGSNGI